MSTLGGLTSLPIKSIRIPKDPTYGCSKGACFVELHTTLEASQLFAILTSQSAGFIIDNCPASVYYAKRNPSGANSGSNASNVASAALAAAQWANQSEGSKNTTDGPYEAASAAALKPGSSSVVPSETVSVN